MRRFLQHPLTLTGGGILLLIFLLRFIVHAPLERIVASTFYPVQSRLYAIADHLKNLPLFRWSEEREHDRVLAGLIAEQTTLANQVAKYRFAAEENQTLRKLLKFREESRAEIVTARVLARRMDSGTFSVFLDRGADDGLQVGMPVVTNEGVLVGKIAAVHASLSEAILLPDPRFRAAVTLTSVLETSGYMRGEGGVSILMDLIPAEQTIREGDLVVTSGLEIGIPRGYVIGTIEQILPSDQSLFRRAAIQPLIPLGRITDVAIVLPPTAR